MKHQAAGQMNGSRGRRPLRDPAPTAGRSILKPQHRLPAFAVGVLVLEAVAYALQLDPGVTPFVLVVIPAATAAVVSWASGGRREVQTLVVRLFVWRVDARWYLAALGIPVAEKFGRGHCRGPVRGHYARSVVAASSASALLVPVVVTRPGHARGARVAGMRGAGCA